MNKKILITGGAGFIGSHLVDIFLEHGYTVGVADNFSTGNHRNIEGKPVNVYEVDITDLAALDKVIDEFRPDIISHQAAQVSVRRSLEEPDFDATVNITGTINLLRLAVVYKVKQFTFASSGGAIYGECTVGASSEEDLTNPLSPYGLSKQAAEAYINYYARTHSLRTTILRYSNVYGPRQNAVGEAGVIAIFLDNLVVQRPLAIYGTGEQMRDFVFVGDVARANFLAVEGEKVGTYNISSGEILTVNSLTQQLLEAWRAATDKPASEIVYKPAVPGEIFRSAVSPQKAQEQLHWKSGTSFIAGLTKTTEWVLVDKG